MNPHRRSPFVIFMTVLVFLFLYVPIFVLVLYSFNASRTNVTFEGFITAFGPLQMQGSSGGAKPVRAVPLVLRPDPQPRSDDRRAQHADDCLRLHPRFYHHRHDGRHCSSAARFQNQPFAQSRFTSPSSSRKL